MVPWGKNGESVRQSRDCFHLPKSHLRASCIQVSVDTSSRRSLLLVCEERNEHDHFAICVSEDESIVSHVPMELSWTLYHILKHEGCATCEIPGKWKRGHQLEVPCMYCFVAKQCLVKKLKSLLQSRDVSFILSCLNIVATWLEQICIAFIIYGYTFLNNNNC